MRISDWNSDVCSSDLQVPSHTHAFAGTAAAANARSAQDSLYAASSANLYAQPDAQVTLAGSTVQDSGSGSPHDNMQPYRTLNFCVALAGVFPSRKRASAGKAGHRPDGATRMSNPFVGEVRLVGFNFMPQDWHDRDGRLWKIAK